MTLEDHPNGFFLPIFFLGNDKEMTTKYRMVFCNFIVGHTQKFSSFEQKKNHENHPLGPFPLASSFTFLCKVTILSWSFYIQKLIR